MVFSLALAGPPARGAVPAVSPQIADSLLRVGDWAAARRAYVSLAKREPDNGRWWFRLGNAQYGAKRYRAALVSWGRAESIGHNPAVMYNLATGYALLGDRDSAFVWLNQAAVAGFSQSDQLNGDEDLASLRDDPRYADVLGQVHANAAPCESRPESHQFDFWIGEWDVHAQQGPLVGHSSIQQILGQCVLLENWSGVQGGSGKSFNAYDSATGTWRQFWVDDHGKVTVFTDGQYQDGVMRFLTRSKDASGHDVLGRLSFHNLGPDRVRQWKERSLDGGGTWQTDYDFLYERKR